MKEMTKKKKKKKGATIVAPVTERVKLCRKT